MKAFLILFFAFTFSPLFSQNLDTLNEFPILEKTNIEITFPSDFKKNPSDYIGSLINEENNISVNGSQYMFDKPLTFLFKLQKNILKEMGMPIFSTKKFKHHNQEAFLIHYQPKIDSTQSFILFFGDKNLQNMVSILFRPEDKALAKKIILSSKINTSIKIKGEPAEGFTTKTAVGKLYKTYSTKSSIEYSSMDGKLALFLNKVEKEDFEGLKLKEYIEDVKYKYYPMLSAIKEKSLIIKNIVKGYEIYYKAVGFSNPPRYDYIAVFESEKFNILIRGRVTNLSDIKYLKKIINTIKIK